MTDVDMKAREAAAASQTPSPGEAAAGRAAAKPERQDGSFGRALAAAREARGLSQSDVAAQLRLSLRQVQAIEAEDLAALPEGPFVRGYVRNYARLVDLSPEPLLALLGARLRPADPLQAHAATRAVSPIQRTPGEPRSGLIVIAVALAVLALLAFFGWRSMKADEAAPARESPASTPATNSGTAPPLAEAPAQAAPDASPAAPAQAPAAQADAPAPTDGRAPLRFTFRDRSWVEVRQADGTLLLSQTHGEGTTKVVEGKPPYLIVIGNASKVDLAYRGEPVDLAASIGRGDIARLRLE